MSDDFDFDSAFDFDGSGHLNSFERTEQFNEECRDFQHIYGGRKGSLPLFKTHGTLPRADEPVTKIESPPFLTEHNMDTGCVELRYSDGTKVAINCTAGENEVADNRFQRSGLD